MKLISTKVVVPSSICINNYLWWNNIWKINILGGDSSQSVGGSKILLTKRDKAFIIEPFVSLVNDALNDSWYIDI